MAKNYNLKIILYLIGIWWTIAFLQATIQLYFLTKIAIIIPIGTLISLVILYLHYLLYKKSDKILGKIIIKLYSLLHFIPLILQLRFLEQPGFDNIITALIGLILYYSITKK